MTEPKSDKPLRPDLQQVLESRAAILDDARPKAVAQQRKRGRWTAREGIAALPHHQHPDGRFGQPSRCRNSAVISS